MDKIKKCIHVKKCIWFGIGGTLLLFNLYYSLAYELKVWTICLIFWGIGIIVLGLIMYGILGTQFCWIEISGVKINLLNLKGEEVSFNAGDIEKIVYGIMFYELYFRYEGKSYTIQCPPGVRVYKNGKKHRGIWIEDFPQAKFENI